MGELEIDFDGELGRGWVGAAVYRGSFGNVDVAVKSVPNASLPDSDGVSGTLWEEGILQSLHHDNVVKIYHVERHQHFRFFVLELSSSTLQHCFLADMDEKKYRGPLPSEVEGLLQMVSGLEYLHSKNMVHGNIKPGNVLVSSGQSSSRSVQLKLSDFGQSSGTREQLSVWTAPEIVETMDDVRRLSQTTTARSDTTRSDTWSLGCVLFFFLEQGRHPFGDKNIIGNIMGGNPNLLRERLKNSSNYLWKLRLIGQMIERDAKNRLPLTELKNHLELVLCYMNETVETAGRSLLHFAAEMENSIAPVLMAEFLSRTTNVNVKDESGRTPLALVAANKSQWGPIMIQQLLQKGAKMDQSAAPVNQMNSSNNHQQSPAPTRHSSVSRPIKDDGGGTEEISPRQRCQTMPAAVTHSTSSPLDLIQQILDNGRNVNERDRSGRTPLHYAVCIVHQSAPDIVAFLIEKGASVGIKDVLGRTPLHSATMVESDYALQIVQILLKERAYDNVNEMDQLGWTPLHFAVRNERKSAPEIVRFLINKGAMVEIKDTSGKNPLHGAIENQSNQTLEIVQLLLAKTTRGASTNDRKKSSCNHLLTTIQMLLTKKPVETVNAKDRYGRTPIHYAVCMVHQSAPEIVRCLMAKGATDDIKDGGGRTALHAVMKNESPHVVDVLRILLEQTDSTNDKDNFGSTPLHLAVRNKHESAPELVRLLIEKGASVTVEDSYGRTPLLLATTNESSHTVEIIQILLEKGAHVNIKDKMARTPLHWATENRPNALAIIRVLLAKGGDKNIEHKDKNGLTPVQCAQKNQSQCGPDVHQLLLSAAEKLKRV